MSRVRAERWMILVILGAFALRSAGLDQQELRGDEAFGYFYSLQSLGQIYRQTLALAEPHPIASYWLQHYWLAFAGHSEFALRWPSMWAGTLAVALIYRLGHVLCLPRPIAIAAAVLLGASPYTLWHSQDARMYSLSLALTLASTLLAVSWQRAPRPAAGGGYVIVSLLALHTHYFAIFVLAAQTAYMLASAISRQAPWRKAWQWLALQGLVGLLYLPWLFAAGEILASYTGNGDSPRLVEALRRAFAALLTGETWPQAIAGLWAVVALGLVALGGWWLFRTQRRQTLLFLAIYLSLPLALTWLGALRRPIFDARYLVAASPPFYLLAASALGPLYSFSHADVRPHAKSWRRLPLFASALLCLVAVAGITVSLARYHSDPAYSKTRGWRELAADMDRWTRELAPESVRIAQNYPDPTLWYYYHGPIGHLVLPPAAGDVQGARREVSALADAGVRVVVIPLQAAATWDADALAGRALAERYRLAGTLQAGRWPVAIFAVPPEDMEESDTTFANHVQLTASAVEPQELEPGGLLVAHLVWYWKGARLDGREKVFVQLLDGDGKLVAQHDRPLMEGLDPAGGSGVASYVILIPQDLAASPYRLIAGLYDPEQPGAPRILTSDGHDYVTLAEFVVEDRPAEGTSGRGPDADFQLGRHGPWQIRHS